MILPFSQQINGKPTYFVERIHKGIRENYMLAPIDPSIHYTTNYNFQAKSLLPSKIHTIREDKNDRWKVGTNIDFFINCRQKDMFRFAPVLPVVSIQEIFMTLRGDDIEITVSEVNSYIGGDDKYLYFEDKIKLVKNDGFDTYKDFKNYFIPKIEANFKETGNSWFKGKIIHWTDFKY